MISLRRIYDKQFARFSFVTDWLTDLRDNSCSELCFVWVCPNSTQVCYLGSSSAAPRAGWGQQGRWCGRTDSCTHCSTPTTDLWSAPSLRPVAHKQSLSLLSHSLCENLTHHGMNYRYQISWFHPSFAKTYLRDTVAYFFVFYYMNLNS